MKKRILSLIILTVIFAPLAISAQTVEITNPLKYDTFPKLVEAVIDFVTVLALAVAPIMIIVAGYLFISAMGEPEKIKTAKMVVLWTSIGLFVILIAGAIIDFVIAGLGRTP